MHLKLRTCDIRSWRTSDAEPISRYANNHKIWLNLRDAFPHPYTQKDARDYIRAVRQRLPETSFAIAVDDEAITAALSEVARSEGLLLCPEGAATYAAYKQSLADGRVTKNDRVMLFNCATGLKYPLPPVTRTLDRHQPIDYAKL